MIGLVAQMARMGQLPGFACGASFTGTAGVAQSVEQRTRNAKVAGSIPVSGTSSSIQQVRLALHVRR